MSLPTLLRIGKEVKSMYDYPDVPDVVEDGTTFAENAWKKRKL